MHLGQKGHSDASAKELAEMLGGELAKGVDDMGLDSVGGFFRVIGVGSDGLRRKVGVVNRIVDRYGDLEARAVIDWRAGNASPHRLETINRSAYSVNRSR